MAGDFRTLTAAFYFQFERLNIFRAVVMIFAMIFNVHAKGWSVQS
jgi:hypothetical protein